MRPHIAEIFSDEARANAMLAFEAALAHAEARCGVIPKSAAQVIAAKCDAGIFDLDALGEAAATAGNPAIPLVRMLTALCGENAGRYVHWGATSQDVIDTAMVLQLREVLDETDKSLARLVKALAALARKHRETVMAGRTFLQHGLPTTFGYRAATWLSPFLRTRDRLKELRGRLLTLQFGGAVGTLASLGTKAPQVQKALARELGLAPPDQPWHTARDRFAEAATQYGLIAGALAKIARDIILLSQTEIGEISEPVEEGRGGSSTMPQKRNPVGAVAILASCEHAISLVPAMLRAMGHEHERAAGAWHQEWIALPEITVYAASALDAMAELAGGLTVDKKRMRANLDLTNGLVMSEAAMMALAPKLGRLEAHHKIAGAGQQAARENRHLKDVLAGDRDIAKIIDRTALDALFDPATYTGQAAAFVDATLASAGRGKTARKR